MNEREHGGPPALATMILSRLMDRRTAEGALGDLEERYRTHAAHDGPTRARCFYWSQVAAAVPGAIGNLVYWNTVMLGNTLTVAMRNMKRHKVFSAINVGGLAIGLACCVLIMLWVRNELGYDRGYPHAREIHRLYRQFDSSDGRRFSSVNPAALGPALAADYPEIVDAVRFMNYNWSVTRDDQCFNELVALADPAFFDMFSVRFLLGDRETALADLPNIVLTGETARKYFGDEDPIGQTVRIMDWYDAKVTGIIEMPTGNTTLRPFDAMIDFGVHKPLWGRDLEDWKVGNYLTYIRLRPDADAHAVSEKIAGVLQPHFSDTSVAVRMHPLLKERLHDVAGGGMITYVYVFSTIALLVLLIGCFNYMNLSTARSSGRAVEVGVRKVLGAGRGQLVRQFLSEAVLLALLAAGLAVGLVQLLLPHFNRLALKDLAVPVDAGSILAFTAVALAAGLASGSYPAFRLSSHPPVGVLRGVPLSSGGKSWFRRILVVSQFAISIFLIIGSLVIHRQLDYIRGKDLGIELENVMVFPLSGPVSNQFESFRDRLEADPTIVGVTRVNAPPVRRESTASGEDVGWEGKTAGDYIAGFGVMGCDPSFERVFGPEMAAGRFFSADHPGDLSDGVVLNETAVRRMGLDSPLGKRVSIWDSTGRVIGVVKDFHVQTLRDEIMPLAIFPGWGIDTVCIGLTGEAIPTAMSLIERTIRDYEPGYRLESRFLDEMLDDQYAPEERIRAIVDYGTSLAIFVACLGLYGLAAYTAERRTKEIAVRKILGASVAGIVLLLSRDFSRWVLLANLIAWPVAWYAARRWLSGFAYHADLSPVVFLLAGALALVIALLTVSYQSCRAALRNPADALRYE